VLLYAHTIITIIINTFLASAAYDPKGQIRSITKQYKTFLAGMTCHLINNKAVMKQNCIGALNQHTQLLEKKAAFSHFT